MRHDYQTAHVKPRDTYKYHVTHTRAPFLIMTLPQKGIFLTGMSSSNDYNDSFYNSSNTILTPESMKDEDHLTDYCALQRTYRDTPSGVLDYMQDTDISKFQYLLDENEIEASHVTSNTDSPLSEDFSNWLDFSGCSDSFSSARRSSLFKVAKPRGNQVMTSLEKTLDHVISRDVHVSHVSDVLDKSSTANVVLGKIFDRYGNSAYASDQVESKESIWSFQDPPNSNYMPYSPSQWSFINSEFQKLWNELEDCVK